MLSRHELAVSPSNLEDRSVQAQYSGRCDRWTVTSAIARRRQETAVWRFWHNASRRLSWKDTSRTRPAGRSTLGSGVKRNQLFPATTSNVPQDEHRYASVFPVNGSRRRLLPSAGLKYKSLLGRPGSERNRIFIPTVPGCMSPWHFGHFICDSPNRCWHPKCDQRRSRRLGTG